MSVPFARHTTDNGRPAFVVTQTHAIVSLIVGIIAIVGSAVAVTRSVTTLSNTVTNLNVTLVEFSDWRKGTDARVRDLELKQAAAPRAP